MVDFSCFDFIPYIQGIMHIYFPTASGVTGIVDSKISSVDLNHIYSLIDGFESPLGFLPVSLQVENTSLTNLPCQAGMSGWHFLDM